MPDRNELVLKLHAKIDMYKSIRMGVKVVKMEKFINWIQSGVVKLCPINRDEVKNHVSSAGDLMDSIITGFPIGFPTGYVQGVSCPTDDSLTSTAFLSNFCPTQDLPIYLPDYGHRFRWLQQIVDDKVAFCSLALTQLKTEDPASFKRFMNKEVVFELVFSTDGHVPENYIREMFLRLNMSATAVSGEKLKATTDELMDSIIEEFKTNLSSILDLSKVRDGDRTTLSALVRGSSDLKKMTTRDKDVHDSSPLTEAEGAVARTILGKLTETLKSVQVIRNAAVDDAEAKLGELPRPKKTSPHEEQNAYKEAKDRVKAAKESQALVKHKLDLSLHAPLVHGFSMYPEIASGDIHEFLMKVTESKKAWGELVPTVTRAGKTTARSHTTDSIACGWTALLRIVGKLGATSYTAGGADIPITVG